MKKVISFVLRLAFIVASILFLFKPHWFGADPDFFKGVSPQGLWEIVRSTDASTLIWWLVLGTVVKLAGIVCGIARWKLLLYGQGLTMPMWELAQSWFMGRAVGLFLPATLGLDGLRLVDSAQRTREPIKCATVIAVEKLTGFVALTFLVFLTFPMGFRLFDINIVILSGILGVLGIFVVTSFLLLLNPRIIQVLVSIIPLPGKIHNKLEELGIALTAYSRNRGALVLAVFLGLGVHFAICLMHFCTAAAVRADNTSLADILFVTPLIIYASVLTPTVSGIGVREVIMALTVGHLDGTGKAVVHAHLGLWAGEIFPFLLSIPLLLKVRPDREEIQTELAEVRDTLRAHEAHVDLPPGQVAAYRVKVADCLLAGLLGGIVGGAILGLTEASWLISRLSGLTEYQALWWGPLAYGLCFAAAGLGVAGGLLFIYLLVDRFAHPTITFGLTVAAMAAGPGFIGTWWRYKRDVLLEHAPSTSQSLTIVAAVLGLALAEAIVCSLIPYFTRGAKRIGGIAAALLVFIAIILAGWGVNAATAPEPVKHAFQPETVATGPNVILIAIDTLRADYLKLYRADAPAETPALDAFAQDSILFSSAFAQSSWTKPSFGTIFTGLYPTSHGATTKTYGLDPAKETFPETMLAGGYYTQGFANNPNISTTFGFDQGFVEYIDLGTERNLGAEYSSSKLVVYEILRKVKEKLNARLPGFLGGGRINIREYYHPAEDVTDTGLAWIDQDAHGDAPFFLFLHYMDPHDPFMDPLHPGRGYARSQMENPDPKAFQEAFVRAYISEIEYLDEHLGRLFEGLKARGIYDDSVIVLTSDHGEEFHEHGGWWHGQTLFDEVIGVPLLIKLPQHRRGGEVHREMARLLDIAPTILSLTGLPVSPAIQGQTLVDAGASPGNVAISNSYAELDFEGIVMDALRTPTFKLIHSNENKRSHPPVALYNLETDPGEHTNLAGDPVLAAQQHELEAARTGMQDFLAGHAADPSIVEDLGLIEDQMRNTGYLGGDEEVVEE